MKETNEFKQLKRNINYAHEIMNCEYDERKNSCYDELGEQLEGFLYESVKQWELIKERENQRGIENEN